MEVINTAMVEAVVDWLDELPEEAGELTPAQLIEALDNASLTLTASDGNIRLRDAVLFSLRNGVPIEQVLALVGQALQMQLSEDHNVGTEGATQPRYPYEDGDVLVLGPQVFIGEGGVINYKGENFTPQTVPTDELPSEERPA